MLSIVKEGGKVFFPKTFGERHYQIPFFKKTGLPIHLKKWQPTIDVMLNGIDTDDMMFLMVDQKKVKAKTTHRRGGAHVDGNYYLNYGWKDEDRWKFRLGRHGHVHHNLECGGIVLASDISACEAYDGVWDGMPGKGGDCAHIPLDSLYKTTLKPNKVYLGNVAMLHESIPVAQDCNRTLVRITLPDTYSLQ